VEVMPVMKTQELAPKLRIRNLKSVRRFLLCPLTVPTQALRAFRLPGLLCACKRGHLDLNQSSAILYGWQRYAFYTLLHREETSLHIALLLAAEVLAEEQRMAAQVFKVATFNVNSVRMRLDLVTAWLQSEQPDVLCLQEIKVQDVDFPADPFRNMGYHIVFRGQKAHAGVAIASKEEPRDVSSGLDDGGEPDPARLIRGTVNGIPIVNTYVPQGQSVDSSWFQYKLEWLARLRRWFERHYSPNEPLIWVGDFNVAPEPMDVHDPKGLIKHADFHPDARAALQAIKDWGFVDVFRQHHPEPGQFTFWDYRVRDALERNIGWRVDHIWATRPLAARSARAWIDVEARRAEKPSDHTFLVAEFEL